jgi:hypothetical protein
VLFDLTPLILSNQVAEFIIRYYFVPNTKDAYCVGMDGTVWTRWVGVGKHSFIGNEWRRRVLTPNQNGYLHCVFSFDWGREVVNTHQLVARLFIGHCPLGLEICHNDGNQQNNHVCNLRYDNKVSNAQDRFKHGTHNRSDCNNTTVLTWDLVNQIREEWVTGKYTQKELGNKYGVTSRNIGCIVGYKTWIPDDLRGKDNRDKVKYFNHHNNRGERNPRALLTQNLADQIREEYVTGKYTQAQLGKKYGVSQGTIMGIITYRTWIPVDLTDI